MSHINSDPGALSALGKADFIRQLVMSQIHEQLNRWVWRFKLSPVSRKKVSLNAMRVPDTGLVKETEVYVVQFYSPVMYAHCQRTWCFAWTVAQAFDIKFDEESFYIACLMHDLGLTEPCCQHISTTGFQVLGAQESMKFLQERNVSERDCALIHKAICQHLHPGTRISNSSAEAYLLKVGAHMDVIGSYSHWINEDNLKSIHGRHSRVGFNTEIIDTMNLPHQANSHAGMLASLGFEQLVLKNPLNRF